jgi:hypothetical protein
MTRQLQGKAMQWNAIFFYAMMKEKGVKEWRERNELKVRVNDITCDLVIKL